MVSPAGFNVPLTFGIRMVPPDCATYTDPEGSTASPTATPAKLRRVVGVPPGATWKRLVPSATYRFALESTATADGEVNPVVISVSVCGKIDAVIPALLSSTTRPFDGSET